MTSTSVVFRVIVVFALVLGLWNVDIKAQVTPPRTVTFALPPAPDAAALARRDLAWIRTGIDFDQDRLSAELIDKEIESRIKAYDRETAIVTFDVPLNSKRFFKPQRAQTYRSYSADIGVLKRQPPLDNEAYFWRYRDIDIAVPGDTYQDQLNVHAVARALEIIRCRYPKAYQKLFVETRAFAPQAPTKLTYMNRIKTLLVSFHTYTNDIAEGGPVLGVNDTPAPAPYGKYSNLGVISINPKLISGTEPTGSSILYNKSADENYVRYLREGLVETLVHEMLHRFIDTRAGIDDLETLIFNARPAMNGTARPLNNLWEEVFITNTSLSYFIREGGLQPSVPYHYRSIIEGNIAELEKMRLKGEVTDMSRLTNFNSSKPNHVEIMRLKVLD